MSMRVFRRGAAQANGQRKITGKITAESKFLTCFLLEAGLADWISTTAETWCKPFPRRSLVCLITTTRDGGSYVDCFWGVV